MGNLRSVVNAFEYVGAKTKLSGNPTDIGRAKAIVVPGQGAFRDCMACLKQNHLAQALTEAVIKQKKAYLGICLGMQIWEKKALRAGNLPVWAGLRE